MAQQWLSLVGAIWVQSASGTNANFAAYSSRLKHRLSISQVQLNNLASASDAGKLFGWFSGLAALYFPLWLVLLIGSMLGFVGYGVQYLYLQNVIKDLYFWQVVVLTAVAGNSICWINTVCYIIVIKNFPADRQAAVGISTSYAGLSAKIFSDVAYVINVISHRGDDRAEEFLLLNSVIPLFCSVLVSPLAREIGVGKSRKLTGGFTVLFVITVVTGVYAVMTTIFGSKISSSKFLIRMSLGGIIVLLFLPALVPLAQKIVENAQGKCLIIRPENRVYDHQDLDGDSPSRVEPFDGVVKDVNDNNNDNDNSSSSIYVVEDVGPKVMLKRLDFWLYFFVYFLGATLGLVFLNNLGQIAESHGIWNPSLLVSLSSSFGFVGRLLPSLYDYFFSRSKYKISRGATIVTMMAPMCGAFFLLLHHSQACLYTSTAIIGVCTSAITSVAVSTTTELFGVNNFGVNHNILVTNIPIGSFVFGDFAAYLYKKQEKIHGTCMGMHCFHTTFLIWGCLCFLGTCLAICFYKRTQRFTRSSC